MFGLWRHRQTEEDGRCADASSAAATAAAAPADHPPTERSAPQYGDLVNVDFPSEQEYKHHTSNWDAYERRDFNLWYRSIAREDKLIRYIIRGIAVLLLAPLALPRVREWIIQRLAEPIVAEFPWIDPIVVNWTAIVVVAAIVIGFWRYISSLRSSFTKTRNLLEGFNPVPNTDLVGLSYVPWLVRSETWIAGALRRVSAIRMYRIDAISVTGIRTIWLGNGQIQFGCGPKGFSIEHHGGVLYLLHWDKVEDIYDADDKSTPYWPGTKRVVYGPEQVALRSRRESAQEPGRGGALIKRAGQAIKGRWKKMRERRDLYWAQNSIRVRLKKSDDDKSPDEIVVPKRFFKTLERMSKTEDNDGPHKENEVNSKNAQRASKPGPSVEWVETWPDFLEQCRAYKFDPEHADGAGKSAGQIETGRPAHH